MWQAWPAYLREEAVSQFHISFWMLHFRNIAHISAELGVTEPGCRQATYTASVLVMCITYITHQHREKLRSTHATLNLTTQQVVSPGGVAMSLSGLRV
jgi:hypothetical protein